MKHQIKEYPPCPKCGATLRYVWKDFLGWKSTLTKCCNDQCDFVEWMEIQESMGESP